MAAEIAAPKSDLNAKLERKTILKQSYKKNKRKTGCKIKKLLPKHHSPPLCSHDNAIYESQLQKTIVLRTQPQQRGTLTQPFHCDLRTELQSTRKIFRNGYTHCRSKTGSRRPNGKTMILHHFSTGIGKGKSATK